MTTRSFDKAPSTAPLMLKAVLPAIPVIGGLPGIEKESIVLHEKGPGRVSPHFVHGRLINLISGQVSIKYGLMGPNHAVVTACSTGAHSIGDAARMIAQNPDKSVFPGLDVQAMAGEIRERGRRALVRRLRFIAAKPQVEFFPGDRL